MNELVLVKSANLNGVELDCYVELTQQDTFWATRTQIGQLLGYEYPREAIGKIHERNKERLDKFSAVVKLTTPSGVQQTTIYNFKGLLEVCRYSQQPNANAVIDVLWEIADEIRRTGSYSVVSVVPSNAINEAASLYERAGLKGNQLTLALDKLYKSYTGRSALQAAEIVLKTPAKKQLLTATDIGRHYGISANRVNNILANAGLQHKVAGKWKPLPKAESLAVLHDTGKRHSDGTPVCKLKWRLAILEAFDYLFDKEAGHE